MKGRKKRKKERKKKRNREQGDEDRKKQRKIERQKECNFQAANNITNMQYARYLHVSKLASKVQAASCIQRAECA